jgi:DNA repair photolyase
VQIKEVKTKTILNPCGIAGIDFVINPYIGCSFACRYCYASFMGRLVGKRVEEWGSYVFPKVNAVSLLKKELAKKLKDKGARKEIFFSSVTDPYQGIEVRYQLTRGCLEALLEFGFLGTVSILTKSDLVLRDLDLFKKFKHISVGLTVTSTNDEISRYFEKYAPVVSKRFSALKTLNQNKIPTYAFIGPLLPHFSAKKDELEKIFKKLVEVGTKDIFIEHLNLSSYIRSRLIKETKEVDQKIINEFYLSSSKAYRKQIEAVIYPLIEKYRLRLLKNQVIYHKEFN